jgi:hypothetical protein
MSTTRVHWSENTLNVNHLCSEKVMYNKYHNMQQVKILMAFFGNFSKHEQKNLDLYDNIILWNSL